MANVSSSNSQGALVPKLRFPEFENDSYTPETVGSLFDHASRRNADGKNGNVITNSAEHGLIPQRDFFDKDIAVEGNTSNYYIIKKGDFVYNPRKSTTAPYGPFNCYSLEDEGIVSPLYTCLTPKHKEFTEYLLWYFKSPAWYSYIYHNGAQSGARHDRVGMTNDLMDGIPVNLPCLREQEKVSRFLSILDRRIAAQRKLVEFLKSYKRGVSSALFERRIRMKKSNGSPFAEWEKATLGDIFLERNEKALGGEKLIAVTISNGIQDRSDLDLKDNSSEDKSNYRKVHVGDIAYNTMRMWQGACGVSSFDGIVSPAYTVLYASDKARSDSRYWAYLFKEIRMMQLFQRNSQGLTSDTWNLKYDKFAKIAIDVPSLEEQVVIANVLDGFSSKIVICEDSLERMERYKRSLLSKMFI